MLTHTLTVRRFLALEVLECEGGMGILELWKCGHRFR